MLFKALNETPTAKREQRDLSTYVNIEDGRSPYSKHVYTISDVRKECVDAGKIISFSDLKKLAVSLRNIEDTIWSCYQVYKLGQF